MKRILLRLPTLTAPLLVAPFLVLGAAALAQTAAPPLADSVIAGRQAGYELLQAEVGALKVAVDQGLDPKPYVNGIKAIENWGKTIPAIFPDGTQTGHNTAAKPEIWSDRAGFEKASANMVAAAEKLEQLAAASDKDGFKTQFAALGGTCGACHRAYRVQR